MVEGQARSGRGDPPRGFPIRTDPRERATGTSAIKARVRSTSIRFASTTALDAVAAPMPFLPHGRRREEPEWSTVRRACATSSRCPAVSSGSTGSGRRRCRQATREQHPQTATNVAPVVRPAHRRLPTIESCPRGRSSSTARLASRDRARDAHRRARAAGRRGVDADPIRDVRELQHAMRAREDEVLARSLARYLLGVRQGGGAHDAEDPGRKTCARRSCSRT